MNLFLLRPGAFRLALAGLVFISHVSNIQTGRIGVALFFLLSGYWISDLWSRQSVASTGLFFLNRFLRIWPIYMVVVLVAAWLLGRTLHIPNIILFGVASMQGVKPLGVEWSLDIEAQFYLLLPLIMLARLPAWLALPATIAGWILVWFSGIHTVFMYMPAFAAGMFLFRQRDRPIPVTAIQSLLAFFGLSLLLLVIPATRPMFFNTWPDPINEDIFAMLWSLPLVFYIAHSLRQKSGKLDRHIGNVTFPFYLIHEVLIQYIPPDGIFDKVGLLSLSIASAIIIYVVLDIPIESFRHRLLRRLQQRREAALVAADR